MYFCQSLVACNLTSEYMINYVKCYPMCNVCPPKAMNICSHVHAVGDHNIHCRSRSYLPLTSKYGDILGADRLISIRSTKTRNCPTQSNDLFDTCSIQSRFFTISRAKQPLWCLPNWRLVWPNEVTLENPNGGLGIAQFTIKSTFICCKNTE